MRGDIADGRLQWLLAMGDLANRRKNNIKESVWYQYERQVVEMPRFGRSQKKAEIHLEIPA